MTEEEEYILDNQYIKDSIKITDLLGLLIRKKKQILSITGISLIITGIYGQFIKDPVWKGEIQIVISEDKKSKVNFPAASLISSNPTIADLAGVDQSSKSSLKTQVEILKSPSVLMPIFEFIKQQKESNGLDVNEWAYTDWLRDNISVALKKKTSVLHLTYVDTDKDLILPALNKISTAYQFYSNRDRNIGIKKGIKYLENQANTYQAKAKESRLKLQSFAIKHNLFIGKDITGKLSNQVNRVKTIEQLNKTENLIKLIDDDNFNNNNLISLLENSELSEEYSELVNEKIMSNTFFTNESKKVKDLKIKEEEFLKEIKKEVLNKLNGERINLLALKESVSRPANILLEFGELGRNSLRDEKTLNKIEAELSVLKLEKELSKDPWELITKPTIFKDPISPNKKSYLVIAATLGFLIGIIYSVFIESKEGIIYSKDFLFDFIDRKIFIDLTLHDPERRKSVVKLLRDEFNQFEAEYKSGILEIGNNEKILLDDFKEKFNTVKNRGGIVTLDSSYQIKDYEKLIIVLSLGGFTKKDLISLNKILTLKNFKRLRWVLLN